MEYKARVTIREPGKKPRVEIWDVEPAGTGFAVKPPGAYIPIVNAEYETEIIDGQLGKDK